ncbi:hypothetical protein [Saccharopolyspora sp. CA-218241]|uniref:hypothetical protein n=1 Tax=Saccharopolyspora sp. CA-218241 TaxID=3240027 RepID=UPI003D98299B
MLSPRQAADNICTQLREADFVPEHFGLAQRGQRSINNAGESLEVRVKGQELYSRRHRLRGRRDGAAGRIRDICALVRCPANF